MEYVLLATIVQLALQILLRVSMVRTVTTPERVCAHNVLRDTIVRRLYQRHTTLTALSAITVLLAPALIVFLVLEELMGIELIFNHKISANNVILENIVTV